MLKVNEIFYSIQGETTSSGIPSVFVRLTGCNLRCSYCDTRYAYYDGKDYEVEEILEKLKKYHCNLVTITGGEPLLQEETFILIKKLLDKGYKVLVETNGTIDISKVDKRSIIIMDIKCPSSNEEDRILWGNVGKIRSKDEIKFVISNREDYEWSKNIISENNLENKNILFSPEFEVLEAEKLATWILKDRLDVRLQLQLHKLIRLR